MTPADDLKFMHRCLELAKKAEGMTYPNPMVGAVVVNKGKIIGEGYHLRSGGPHAEVIAIESVKDKSLLTSSVLYVNLEPCSHFGKTPPCADLIISKGIPAVVAGTTDPSAKVSGKGFEKLRNAGCNVTVGVAEDESRRLNKRFITFHERHRPYITLKWAQSSDGYLDQTRNSESERGPLWITGETERLLVHKWRAAEQTILIGAGTLRTDDPLLNVREWQGNNPVRLILSGSGLLPANPSMCSLIGSQVIFTFYPEKVIMPGAVVVKLNSHESSAYQIVDYLYRLGIQSLFIEGGAQVLTHFLASGLWDEARIFYGRSIFKQGIKAPEPEGRLILSGEFEKSSLKILLNNT